ncbi:cytochrome b [Aeromonas veronii]|uniref:cytochrome b n=1 Tax=Aeromonas veronii TaxID=654 RepID=UPI003BA26352
MLVKKYHGTMIVFHWLIAILMTMVIFFSLFYWSVKTFHLPFTKDTVFATFIGHETVGFFLLLATVVRICNSLSHRAERPRSINADHPLKHALEKAVHLFLQYGVILLTLLGWATANAKGYELRLFWQEWLTLPNLVELGDPKQAATNTIYQLLLQCHSVLAFAMTAVVLLHITAVMVHRFKGHNLLTRMLLR